MGEKKKLKMKWEKKSEDEGRRGRRYEMVEWEKNDMKEMKDGKPV